MTRLLRHRGVLAGLHGAVLLGLIVSLVITYWHQGYMTRGVSEGGDLPPIPHTDVNPLGVNTFLHEEVETERVDRTLEMIADAGFSYIRQIFVWSEIEPNPDTYRDPNQNVSSWAKYDRIMEYAAEHGLEVVVRLDKPPRWAREGQPNLDQFPDGPPNDEQDYADFVAEVVSRYEGQIRYVQLWNEPNLGVEWGGQEIDPAGFTELLAAGYQAVKEVDPDVQVIMPGLAPNDQTGPNNLSDLLFLEGMYEAGAEEYFDIASVMVYGYGYSPWDRRASFERNNFSRVVQTREIMEEYGDAETPIWALEYGWVSLPDDWEGEASPWGEPVSEEEQARYLYEGYLRAQQEWPWMGAMMTWAFRWATDPEHPDQVANPTRGFRIVNHDFTPRPAYERLSRARPVLDRAFTGSYRADSRYLVNAGGWSLEGEGMDAALHPVEPAAELLIPFAGTGIELELTGGEGEIELTLDGEEREVDASELADGTYRIDDLNDGPHLLELSVSEPGEDPLAITGFTVHRHTMISWIYPWIYAAIGVAILLNLASLTGIMVRRRDTGPVSTDGSQ